LKIEELISWIQDARYRIQDSGCKIFKAESGGQRAEGNLKKLYALCK
jgi:hypothetical protein